MKLPDLTTREWESAMRWALAMGRMCAGLTRKEEMIWNENPDTATDNSLKGQMKRTFLERLEKNNGNIAKTARELQVPNSTAHKWMKKWRSGASALVLLVPFLSLGQQPLTNLPPAPNGPIVIPIPIAWDYPAVSYPAITRVEWWTNGGAVSNATINSRPLSNFLAVPVPTPGRWNIRAVADYGGTQTNSATISAVITNPVTVTLGNLSGTTQQVVWIGPPPITNKQAFFRSSQRFYWRQVP